MQFYDVERRDGALAVEHTRLGRLADGVVRCAVWAPLAMFGLSLLFMPDYVCQYREQQPVPGLFWGVMAAAASVIAAIAGFVRYARRDTWLLDVREGVVVFRANPLVGPAAEASAELSNLSLVRARRAGPLRVSGVAVELDGHPDEEICESRFGWSTVSNVYRELKAFAEEHRLDVDFNSNSESL
jgi:hypothetical protein